MNFVFNDGGRSLAGYKGFTGDCVTRAIAIATGLPYQQVYETINELSKFERTGRRKKKVSNARLGVFKTTYRKFLLDLGWKWIPTMEIGSGCKVHLKGSELPQTGTLIVSVSKHLTVIKDGEIHDIFDPSRGGNRCVYGYFVK